MMRHTQQLEAMAVKENMLIVYPDGYKRYWNECRSMSTAEANKIDINEQLFFESMIAFFHKNYGVKQDRVFAAGFSGGGHMAYKLALTMPQRFRAVAAIVANMPDSAYCDCTEKRVPISVLIINGTEDPVNPFNGGEMFVNNASFGVVKSTEGSFRYWSQLAGYAGNPVEQQLPDTDTTDHRIIRSYDYSSHGKPEINLLKVIGGKHDYPRDIDVYEYVGQFFRRQLLAK
jgi:polyhydroxybutyrate depolymerase